MRFPAAPEFYPERIRRAIFCIRVFLALWATFFLSTKTSKKLTANYYCLSLQYFNSFRPM